MKKLLSGLFLLAFLIGFLPVGTFAQGCTDEDGDHYYSSSDPEAENLKALGDTTCGSSIGIRGYEIPICDCPNLGIGKACKGFGKTLDETDLLTIMADPVRTGLKKGQGFNPKASDNPGDGIDQNCDGEDAKVSGGDNKTDIPALIEKAVSFLGAIVAGVSTLFLIWGGIMYASAAGEEEKLRKARKTMVGAIVGLIIGVLAYTLIGIVIAQITG